MSRSASYLRSVALSALLLCGGAPAGAMPLPDPSSPDLGARVKLEVRPALAARASSARARAEALAAVLEGRATLEAALPALGALALDEPAVTAGRLRALDHAAEARAAERARVAHPALAAAIGAELAAVHDLEEAADALERRALAGLRAWLTEAPWARSEAVDAALAPQRAAIEAGRREGADDGAIRAATAADAERARTRALVRALRDVYAFGAALPDPAEDLARLERDPLDEPALVRVAMLRERAGVDLAAALDAALDAAAAADATPAEGPGPSALSGEALQRALDLGPPALGRALTGRRARAAAAPEATAATSAATTLVEAETARQDATSAAAITARLIEARVPAEKRVAALEAESEARSERFETEIAAALAQMDEMRALVTEAASSGRNPDRAAITSRYPALPALLQRLRERARELGAELVSAHRDESDAGRRIEAERARVRDERHALSTVADPGVRQRRTEALDRWSATLDAELGLLRGRADAVQGGRERILALIPQVAQERSAAFRYLPSSVRSEERGHSLVEAVDELSLVGPTYSATVRSRWHAFWQDAWWWLDLRVLGGLALGSFSLLLGAAVWLLVRRQARALASVLVGYVDRRTHVSARELAEVRPALHLVLRAGVDVVGALLLLRLVPAALPELYVLLLLLFEAQLLRFELAAFELAVARRPALRPALFALTPAAWRVARRTVLALGVWVALRRVSLAFAQDLLAGFATEHLARLATTGALVFMVVVLLYAWAPHVRDRVAREAHDGPVFRWLGVAPPTVLLAGPQCLAGLGILLYFAGRRAMFGLARRGSGSRWTAALDVLRFGRKSTPAAQAARRPLPPEVRAHLLQVAREQVYVERPKARDALVKELRDWRDDDLQGLIALLGDAGEGTDAALAQWAPHLASEGFEIRRVAIDRRLRTEADAMRWLAEAFDLPRAPQGVDDAAALLAEALPPGVIHVDRLNLAFLRTVDGFGALRALLEVFHADGFDRCWVLAFYRPAWRYLERLGSAVNVHLVRATIDLSPLSGEQLRELTDRVAEGAGFTLDFDALVRAGALSATPEEEKKEAIEAFYRMLTAASAGNPSIALALWVTCLERGDGSLRVGISESLRGLGLPDLGDEHLFVLAALRTHRTLDESEIAEVLNVAQGIVRALVRQMIASGLIAREGVELSIPSFRLQAVTALLRRRHFLHWS